MDSLQRLQQWYHSQCNGVWEHSWGVKIDTLDNPGWTVEIELRDTTLEARPFTQHSYGVGPEAGTSKDEWLVCNVEGNVFKGRGGPLKLNEIIEVFLEWVEKNR
jgi:hypothetical protein